jgi:MFS family permease
LINANFTRLWIGQAISSVGDWIFATTLALWIAGVLFQGDPRGAVAMSGVPIAMSLATVVVGPVAGVFVDRWDKRRTMMISDLIRAALVSLLVIVALLPPGRLDRGVVLALIYAVVFASSAVGKFFGPARFTLLSDIVPESVDRARAAGIGQATEATAVIIGPPLASPLLFAAGFHWALIINAVSFIGSFLAIRSVRPPQAPAVEKSAGTAFWPEFREGVRFAFRSWPVLALMITAVIVTVPVGAMNTLDVFFTEENLHAAITSYGFLGAALGAGTILGSLLAGRITKRLGVTVAFNGCLLAGGVVLLAYTRAGSLIAGVIAIFVFGALLGVVNANFGPLLMAAIPRQLMARVLSVFTPVQQASQIAGALVSGWLATALVGMSVEAGPVTLHRLDTILGAGALLLIVGAIYAGFTVRQTPRMVSVPLPAAPVEGSPPGPDSAGPAERSPADPDLAKPAERDRSGI